MARKAKTPPTPVTYVKDSYVNFAADLGIGTNNLSTSAGYAFNFLTKNRILLEAMYRGSWVIGAAIDIPADDMTHGGITIRSEQEPDAIEEIEEALEDLDIWHSLNSVIKWSRLYGTCLGYIMIDGQKPNTPLDIETVGEGQFKGILPIDRWQVVPSIGNLIKDLGPDLGMPTFYQMVPDAIFPNFGDIHHTRVIRLDAIEQPHYQKMVDTMWAESVIERLNDRIIAFDSTTTGVAQLVYRAYLRTWKIEQLRDIIASGGPAMKGLEANIRKVRQLQTSEGLTVIDAKDEMEFHAYSFAGLDSVLLQFGQQLAGALEIPLVRLFGQSPQGMNSTGESDLQIYFNGIYKKQNIALRRPLKKIMELISRSVLGEPLPDGFTFEFNPLWSETNKERAEIAQANTAAVTQAFESGIIDRATALTELRQLADRSGVFTNIDDELIADAESEPPLSELAHQSMEQGEADLNATQNPKEQKPVAKVK